MTWEYAGSQRAIEPEIIFVGARDVRAAFTVWYFVLLRQLEPSGGGKASCQPHRGPVLMLKGEQSCEGEEAVFM